MTLQSPLDELAADRLISAINWKAEFPEYVFNESKICGYFIIGAGIFSTQNFLEFMLSENHKINGAPISVIVRLREESVRDLFFSISDESKINDLGIHLMQGPYDIFGSIIVASGAPTEWVAYEEINEHFSVLAIFDEKIYDRWSSKESGIWDYVIPEEQIAEKLRNNEWPRWEPDFLKKILESYGRKQP